jgi:hypothetical protein
MWKEEVMPGRGFVRFGGACGGLAGLAGLGYSAAFVVYLHNGSRGAQYADALLLVAGGLLSMAAFIAIYARLRGTEPGFALLGLAFAFAAAYSSVTHGAFDLANLAKPPASFASDVPSSTDPRGFGTFALTGLALAVAGALILRGRSFPVGLGYLAFIAAALLIFIYVGRLVILNPRSPGLHAAAVISGFVVNPLWFGWLGATLWRNPVARDPGLQSAESVRG